jgi:DNA end-binding protein Ku
MRAIWTGAITFGLVNVPVKLYAATEDHDVELHQVHGADGGRIRYERRCEVCGKVVAYDDIDKAYVEGDETVVLTKDEIDAIPQEHDRDITVEEFVPNEQIDPILYERSYYVRPEGKSPKAYVLLRRTLEQSDRTAIVTFALRQKTRLAALRVRGDVLVLQTLLWPDEVRSSEFAEPDSGARVSAKELELSKALVESFSGDFKADQFRDEYQEQLRTLVEAKLEQGDALDTEATFGEREAESDAEVIDLMEALRKSVERSRATKRGSGTPKTTKAGKPTTKKKATGNAKATKKAAS